MDVHLVHYTSDSARSADRHFYLQSWPFPSGLARTDFSRLASILVRVHAGATANKWIAKADHKLADNEAGQLDGMVFGQRAPPWDKLDKWRLASEHAIGNCAGR